MVLPAVFDLLSELPLIIYVSDLKSNELLFLTRYAQKKLGSKVGELCYESIHGSDNPCSFCKSGELVDEQGRPSAAAAEIYNAKLDRWFAERSTVLAWQGRAARLTVAWDITDRIRSAQAPAPQDEYYAAVLKSMAEAALITDPKGRVLWLNPAAAKLTGWQPAAAKNQPLPEVFPLLNTLTRLPAANPVQKALQAGEVSRLGAHSTLLAKGGAEYQIAGSAAPIWDKRRHFLGALLVFRDITADYRRRTALKNREERFHGLFQRSLNAIALHEIICDARGTPYDYRFLAVNPALEKMTGLNSKEIVGRQVSSVLPGLEQKWLDIYGEVALKGEPAEFEEYSAELDRHYIVRAYSPGRNQFVTVFQDITARKETGRPLARPCGARFPDGALQPPLFRAGGKAPRCPGVCTAFKLDYRRCERLKDN